MKNNELLKNMSMTCNHAKKTHKNYRVALHKYCAYNDMTPELLMETEEDKEILS